MYSFKTELKKDWLGGRKITVLAKIIGISNVHLTNILNGKSKCSEIIARNMCLLSPENDLDFYFNEVKNDFSRTI